MTTHRGYTLVELSVVLVLIGLITAGGAVYFALMIQQRRYDDTEAKLAAVQRALLDYRRIFRRLPCPGDLKTYNTIDRYFGVEAANAVGCNGTPSATFVDNLTAGSATACTADEHCIYAGMIPVKTLGLQDEAAFDGWGRRIMYVVDGDFAESDAFLAQSEVDSDVTTGATRIIVRSAAGSQLTVAGVYLLLSFGPDGHGAYPRNTETMIPLGYSRPRERTVLLASTETTVLQNPFLATRSDWGTHDGALMAAIGVGGGTGGSDTSGESGISVVSRISSGSTNALQQENCDCTSEAEGTAFDNEFYQSSPMADLSGSAGGFDDIVVYVTRGNLTAVNE